MSTEISREEPSIFGDAIASLKVLKAPLTTLSREHLPNQLPHREQQIRELTAAMANSIVHGTYRNFDVLGPAGTGKTSCVRLAFQQVKDGLEKESLHAEAKHKSVHMGLANASSHKSHHQYLITLTEALAAEAGGVKVDPLLLRNSPPLALKELCRAVGGVIILVLDDLHKLKGQVKKEEYDDLICGFAELNTALGPNGVVNVVATTTSADTFQGLTPSTEQRFNPFKLNFPLYNGDQLYDILDARSRETFKDGYVTPEALRYISDEVAAESGSARSALEMLLAAADRASSLRAEHITLEAAIWAKSESERRQVAETVSGLPLRAKMFLNLIYLHAQKYPARPITFAAMWEAYRQLPPPFGGNMSDKPARGWLARIRDDGLVDTTLSHGGRNRGTQTIITPTARVDAVLAAIQKDPAFAPPTKPGGNGGQHRFVVDEGH